MDLTVKSIAMQQKYKFEFHPLAKKLYNTFIQAYTDNEQVKYLCNLYTTFFLSI